MMMLFDTNALVFLYRNQEDDLNPHKAVKYLFGVARQEGMAVAIPAPSLAEFLIGESDPKKRAEFSRLFSHKARTFRILPFDSKAAHTCCEISDRLNRMKMNESNKEPRQKVKVDRQILAIAACNGIGHFVSSDRQLLNDARLLGVFRKVTDIRNFPIPHHQDDLFGGLG